MLQTGMKRWNKAGFTLIELVIVAAIILLLIGISTPLFRDTFRDLELKDAAYNIGKIIKYGQQKAIIEEKIYRIVFDFDKGAYHLLIEHKNGQEGEPSSSWKKITGRFGGNILLPEGVKLRGDVERITFLPNGRCDKVSLYVANQKNKTFEITTNGRAGYVKVSEAE